MQHGVSPTSRHGGGEPGKNEADSIELTVRQFDTAQWKSFKQIRIEALRSDPGCFGSTLESNLSFTQEHWVTWIGAPGNAVMGLYLRKRLIGFNSAVPWSSSLLPICTSFSWNNRSDQATAYLLGNYIRRLHRGRGYGRYLSRKRLEWTARQRRYSRAIIAYRASNLVAQTINAALGFVEVERRPHVWPDQSQDTMVIVLKEFRNRAG